MFACFGCVKRLVWGNGYDNAPVDVSTQPSVCIDTSNTGTDVVIVKQGKRICGTGAALACAPIVQDKAYFEVKVQCTGIWMVGLATRRCDLQNPLGIDGESWVLRHDGVLAHNGQQKGKVAGELEEGDVIGVSYDHIELNFFRNGKSLHVAFTGVKGSPYPAFFVGDGAILDTRFSDFHFSPPVGFGEIMIEQSLL